MANQLIPFFTDLSLNGFGLPYKIPDMGEDKNGNTAPSSGENAGFGEGQGNEDVSKKLEYESQLDDLKNGVEENQDNAADAHDDGVEMSTDLNTKAMGPEETDGKSDKGEDAELSEEETDETMNDLDKELDTVEQDEGRLDEKLWGDDDEPELEADDEKDIREAENDPALNPKIDDTEMNAKDGDLETIENEPQNKTVSENEDQDNMEQKDETQDQINQPDDKENDIAEESQNKEPKEKVAEEDQLDLQEEASIATKEAATDQNSSDNQDDNLDSMNMSISDDEDTSSNTEQEKDKPNNEKDFDNISEISSLEDPLEDPTQTSTINDDDIDNKLEDVVEHPFDEQELTNPIEQTIKNLSGQQNEQENPEAVTSTEQSKQLPGRKEGTFTVYDIYDENDDEDTDSFTADEETRDNPLPMGEGADDCNVTSDDQHAKSNERDDSDIDPAQDPEKIKDKDTDNEDQASRTKRTLAQREDDNDRLELPKRQKILDALEKKEENTVANNNPSPTQVGHVRHTENNESRVEMIDLVSSSDDCEFVDANSDPIELEQNNEVLMERIANEISLNKETCAEYDSIDTFQLTNLWLECTRDVKHLESELCQQLQIVMQPTKMSKYRGDYKSGKRLNMRKIISYIASHYRKDKIWLRRTKPSKRTYNIALAVDNSSSMSENNCRLMTYQSLALLAKSLSIIEAGSLCVLSFGEQVRCIHEFGTPYVDAIGAQWLRELRFSEKRTSYSKLLEYASVAFAKQAQQTRQDLAAHGNNVSQLLIILSDGRNISSEEDEVKLYLRALKSMRVLTLFVVIDDLKRNNGNSIVDVQRAIGQYTNLTMVNYMELFPFPYYILLRQLDLMPSILGDSLRQWFEMVSKDIP